ATDEDEEEEEDDEVLDPDDVEASLDVILKDRLVVEDEEEEEEDDEPPDPEERAEGTGRIMPRRPGEFVCQSCFLVKHPSQLEDPKRMFCRDCVQTGRGGSTMTYRTVVVGTDGSETAQLAVRQAAESAKA